MSAVVLISCTRYRFSLIVYASISESVRLHEACKFDEAYEGNLVLQFFLRCLHYLGLDKIKFSYLESHPLKITLTAESVAKTNLNQPKNFGNRLAVSRGDCTTPYVEGINH